MNPDMVRDLLYAAFGPLAPFLPGVLVLRLAAQILPFIGTDDLNGPGAPKWKGTWSGQY
jgi:hypothetical protein